MKIFGADSRRAPCNDNNKVGDKMNHKKTSISVFITRAIYFFLLLIIFFFAYLGIKKLMSARTFPFRQINLILNGKELPQSQIKTIIAKNLSGGFFSFKESQLKKSLLLHPWIKAVSIRRIWPDKLLITISEQHPIARWNHAAIFNEEGKLIRPSIDSIPSQLPDLRGPNDSEKMVFNQFMWLKKILLPLQVGLVRLVLSPRQSWEMTLSNGVRVVMGHQNINVRLMRFVQYYPKLIAGKEKAIDYVDLRYPNGLVIKWKKNNQV